MVLIPALCPAISVKSDTRPTSELLPMADRALALPAVSLFISRAVEAAVVALLFEVVRGPVISESISCFSNLLLKLIRRFSGSPTNEFFETATLFCL